MRARTGLVGLVILVLAAVAACDANKPNTTGAPASTQAGHPAGHMATPTTVLPANASPEQVRGQFEQLLGHHALLAVRLMRSVVAGAPDLRQAAEASLKENTEALTQTVSTAYGDAPGDRFGRLWRRGGTCWPMPMPTGPGWPRPAAAGSRRVPPAPCAPTSRS